MVKIGYSNIISFERFYYLLGNGKGVLFWIDTVWDLIKFSNLFIPAGHKILVFLSILYQISNNSYSIDTL